MTIKQQGGIFGRNPTFNDLEVDGTLTVGGNAVPDASTLLVDGDIGSTVQAYDADTAKLDVAQTFTAAQTFNSDVTLGNGAALAIDDQDSIIFGTFASGSTGTLLQGGTSTSYLMYVNGRLRASIDTSGNLDMTATNSGNIKLKSGNGIDFSATAGTGTSELFDDYEEGTWTPTGISAGTVDQAKYTKIGDVVTITLGVSGAITLTNGTIGGLPYSAITTSCPWYFADFAVGSGEIPMPTIAGTSIFLRTADQVTGAISTLGDLTGTYISITATYHV